MQYKLIVWDYQTNSKWTLDECESYDGEGFHYQIGYNYRPVDNSCFVQHFGHEWEDVTYFNDGEHEGLPQLHYNGQTVLLAILSHDEVILENIRDEGLIPYEYYQYSFETNDLKELTYEELGQYQSNILQCTGKNYLFLDNTMPGIEDGPLYQVHMNNQSVFWSPDGKALVYNHSVFDSEPPGQYESYFYDYYNQKKHKLDNRYFDSVIWKR